MSLTPRPNGYVSVAMVDEFGRQRRKYVHRLVADAFCGGISDDEEANHDNFRRSDNRAENLIVGTHLENVAHSRRHGRYDHVGRNSPRGESSPHSKLTSAQVLEIRALRANGRYTYRQLASRFGVSRGNIAAVVKHQTWKAVL